MNLKEIPERKIEGLAPEVFEAVRLLKSKYKAVLTHDSGHTKTGPTWIFTSHHYGSAQVAVRMNKRDLSIYLRDKTLGGEVLLPLIGSLAKLKDTYLKDGRKPANSLLVEADAPYLKPTSKNRLLLVNPEPDALEQILDIYFSIAGTCPDDIAKTATSVREKADKTKRGVTPAELIDQLSRNSEVGLLGEKTALAFEADRLRSQGCPDPENHITHVALIDVGRGYDITSNWRGEERCIEVKTTSARGSDFFITQNERAVLEAAGDKAWIYRVEIDSERNGRVMQLLQNPMSKISEGDMQPVVWRVPEAVLSH